LLHQHLPQTRMMMTLGCFNSLLPQIGFRVPRGVTDIAIEAYHGQSQWLDWVRRLEPFLSSEHRLWMMPFAYGKGQQTEEELIFEAKQIYDFARVDSRVVGLLPFAWYDGVRDKPNVRKYFEQIGSEIVSGYLPPDEDYSLELDMINPDVASSKQTFKIVLIGKNFAPRAMVQYLSNGVWNDYYSVRVAPNVLMSTVYAGTVMPGRYWLRVRNPDGSFTQMHMIQVV